MAKPTITDMERVLRRYFPEVRTFPLLRTLSHVAWELGISRRELLKSLREEKAVLWVQGSKIFIPPDVYYRWKMQAENRCRLCGEALEDYKIFCNSCYDKRRNRRITRSLDVR